MAKAQLDEESECAALFGDTMLMLFRKFQEFHEHSPDLEESRALAAWERQLTDERDLEALARLRDENNQRTWLRCRYRRAIKSNRWKAQSHPAARKETLRLWRNLLSNNGDFLERVLDGHAPCEYVDADVQAAARDIVFETAGERAKYGA